MGLKRLEKKYKRRFFHDLRGLGEIGGYSERKMIEILIEENERKYKDEEYVLFLKEQLKKCK
jgi:hypothetical protein